MNIFRIYSHAPPVSRARIFLVAEFLLVAGWLAGLKSGRIFLVMKIEPLKHH